MSDVSLEELDIDYHRQKYAAHISTVNPETAAYFTRQALQTHSLVIKNALNEAETSAVMIAQNLSEQARYYILYGVARRLSMMRVSYSEILRCIPTDRTEPLNADETATVERDINIIYINIRGALDNYAWCLLHQTTTDKTRKLAPAKVGLFAKEFMADANLADLRPKLSDFSAWHTELKDRRDPAAHRIPLSVPPCVLNPEEASRYAALSLQIFTAKSEQDRNALNAQQRKIGTFSPYFVHHPDVPGTPIYPTLPQDIANLMKIVKLVHTQLAIDLCLSAMA